MWGRKNGLEKKLRETVCPNLLDMMVIVAITHIAAVRYLQKGSANISNIFSNPSIVTANDKKIIERF